ncbi:hypothetical protein V5O48_017784 [Marasmius crinis-equi]|uniref:Uncharacterized protein n=1 Tax=Marasmius crinis-equi TaxID=585013 RepID=A0ABR3EN01_9AGAR
MVSTRSTRYPTPSPKPSRANRKRTLLEEVPELFIGGGSLSNPWQVPPSEYSTQSQPHRLPLPNLSCAWRRSLSLFSHGSYNGSSPTGRETNVEGDSASDNTCSQWSFEYEDALTSSGLNGSLVTQEAAGTGELERCVAITHEVEERILVISTILDGSERTNIAIEREDERTQAAIPPENFSASETASVAGPLSRPLVFGTIPSIFPVGTAVPGLTNQRYENRPGTTEIGTLSRVWTWSNPYLSATSNEQGDSIGNHSDSLSQDPGLQDCSSLLLELTHQRSLDNTESSFVTPRKTAVHTFSPVMNKLVDVSPKHFPSWFDLSSDDAVMDDENIWSGNSFAVIQSDDSFGLPAGIDEDEQLKLAVTQSIETYRQCYDSNAVIDSNAAIVEVEEESSEPYVGKGKGVARGEYSEAFAQKRATNVPQASSTSAVGTGEQDLRGQGDTPVDKPPAYVPPSGKKHNSSTAPVNGRFVPKPT